MQSLMGGQAMANAPSNLGVPAGQGGAQQQVGGQMQLPNGSHNIGATAGGGQGSYGGTGGGLQNGAGSSSNSNTQNLIYPALHLHPLNDTFAPKQINLAPAGPSNRVKIGRQTNAKTVPNPSNGYFDSKVLSRMHAEVWCQDNKVFIKDVRSSNGTFINGERLSPEAQESDVFELHSEDMVEFGIDIVGDDSKTIIHHKVACRVYLVITAEDAMGLRNDFASLYRGGVHGGLPGNNGVGPGAEGGLRRGKAGFSFDHVLSKLQNELQRSKEQWTDLGNLTTTMQDIDETLGGGAPPMTNPPYQHMVPPLVSGEAQSKEAAESASKHAQTIASLQAQLTETQASLATHVDKIKSLEEMLSEHASIKAEVGAIKMQMEQARREMDEAAERDDRLRGSSFGARLRQLGGSSGVSSADDDFDDNMSVASIDTVMASDDVSSAATLRRAPDAHVGPRALPDMPVGMKADDDADGAADKEKAAEGEADSLAAADVGAGLAAAVRDEPAAAASAPSPSSSSVRDDELRAQNAALSARLEHLSKQLESALALSQGLQSQHEQVTETVKVLESRVQTLEREVEQKVGRVEGTVVQAMEGRWTEWKQEIEDGWRREREGWESERDELRKVVKAWDEANRLMEDELNGETESAETASSAPSSLAAMAAASQSASTSVGDSTANAAGPSKLPGGGGTGSGQSSTPRNGSGGRSRRKRHVNSALRSLLYGSSRAGLLVNGQDGPTRFAGGHDFQDDDESSGSASSRTGRWSDDELSSNGQARSVADSTSTRPSTSTGITSPEQSPTASSMAGQKYGSDGNGASGGLGPQGGRNTGKDLANASGGQTTISAAAAGVVVIGVAAWVLAGKSGIAFSIPASATKF